MIFKIGFLYLFDMSKKIKEILKWNLIVLAITFILLTISYLLMPEQIKEEFLKLIKPRKIAVMVLGIVIGVSAFVYLTSKEE